MLTADLVRVRRVGGELQLSQMSDKLRARALELAGMLLGITRDHVGLARTEWDEACGQLFSSPNDKRVGEGLRKLIEDHAEFDAPVAVDPEELRRELFQRAALARRESPPERPFDDEAPQAPRSIDREAPQAPRSLDPEAPAAGDGRARLLAEVARERGLTPAQIEQALYADLRGAQLLRGAPPLSPEGLIALYEQGQAQGVLLKASRVVVEVECASAAGYRYLFHKIKFLRLLCSIHPLKKGYRLEIDGPFSLFESTTKYGLQLALLWPHLQACDYFRLVADVRWGKERTALTFKMEGGSDDFGALGSAEDAQKAPLPEEVAALVGRLEQLQAPWDIVRSPEVLPLPGVGLCVPDLQFQHRETGEVVYLEVLGFWSRDAVWRRVELVERGLPYKILFAVSERLRVSEQALGAEVPGMLYVYKGTMNARAVLDRLEQLRGRAAASPR